MLFRQVAARFRSENCTTRLCGYWLWFCYIHLENTCICASYVLCCSLMVKSPATFVEYVWKNPFWFNSISNLLGLNYLLNQLVFTENSSIFQMILIWMVVKQRVQLWWANLGFISQSSKNKVKFKKNWDVIATWQWFQNKSHLYYFLLSHRFFNKFLTILLLSKIIKKIQNPEKNRGWY